MPSTYLELLHRARAMENDAIAIGLQLIAVAPEQDVPRLAEIANDENSHDRIYVELIGQQEPTMHTNDSLGARVAARVQDALTADGNENHDEKGRFAAGSAQGDANTQYRALRDTAATASKNAFASTQKAGGWMTAEYPAKVAMNYASAGMHDKAAENHEKAALEHLRTVSEDLLSTSNKSDYMRDYKAHLSAASDHMAAAEANRHAAMG